MMDPEDRRVENCRRSRAKSAGDLLPSTCAPSSVIDRTVFSLLNTNSSENRVDFINSYLATKNSTELTVKPPVMSTSSATPRAPDEDMTVTDKLEAVIDTPVIEESCWVKIVNCEVKVCLKVIRDFLMKRSALTSASVGGSVNDEHVPVMSAAVS